MFRRPLPPPPPSSRSNASRRWIFPCFNTPPTSSASLVLKREPEVEFFDVLTPSPPPPPPLHTNVSRSTFLASKSEAEVYYSEGSHRVRLIFVLFIIIYYTFPALHEDPLRSLSDL
jgi:hypothetical protein